MYNKLREILVRCSFEELKAGLGEEVVHLAEYISSDLTPKLLIDTAIAAYGKGLLEFKNLRFILIINQIKNEDSLEEIASLYGVSGNDQSEVALAIASSTFGKNFKTRKLLEFLGLDESYMPTILNVEEESAIALEKDKNDFLYEQLDYQYDIRRRLIKYYKEQEGARALIHMPTGAGKTKTAMHIIQELWNYEYEKKGYILWLAHSEELLRQALSTYQEVWKYLGQFNTSIIKLWGDFSWDDEFPDGAFIFGGIQKMQSLLKRRPEIIGSISSGLNLVVVDECHKAPADKTHELLLNLINVKVKGQRLPNLLGLTATPGRKGGYDIEDIKLKRLFDNVKIGIDVSLMNKYDPGFRSATSEIELLQNRNILSTFERTPIQISAEELGLTPREIKKLELALRSDGNQEVDSALIDKIAHNKKRNELIIEKLAELNNSYVKTIFFACNVAHAKMINAALYLQGIEAGLILGETNNHERAIIIEKFRDENSGLNILINVNVLTTGFDSPNIDCVFISRPITSVILYSQMIGRGIRGVMMGGKPICKLIDVVDNFDFGDEKWAFNYFDSYWKI